MSACWGQQGISKTWADNMNDIAVPKYYFGKKPNSWNFLLEYCTEGYYPMYTQKENDEKDPYFYISQSRPVTTKVSEKGFEKEVEQVRVLCVQGTPPCSDSSCQLD